MNSLPFLTRLIAATILAKQNKALIAEVAYLRAEISFLHEQLPPGALRFTDRWRKIFARAAADVGWKRLAEIATVAKASTIRGWHRMLRKGRLGLRRAKTGRPRVSEDIEALVVRMAQENPVWGTLRIAGELRKMGISLSHRTVAAILDRHGIQPSPQRRTSSPWKAFVADQADRLVATDFFTVDVVGWLGKRTYDVLFAIHLSSRKVQIMGVTEHSNTAYMTQVAREATVDGGWLKKVGAKYLIHDRDTKFCGPWKEVLLGAGVEPLAIPPNSPNLNAFAERWVRTVKRECVRRLWFIGYRGLCEVLHEYVAHYNAERPHQGKGNLPLGAESQAEAPGQKVVTPAKLGPIRCVTRCRGTVRHYYRDAA
jgi:putative transposase